MTVSATATNEQLDKALRLALKELEENEGVIKIWRRRTVEAESERDRFAAALRQIAARTLGEPIGNVEGPKRVTPEELLKQGGEWLGAARNWIKWHVIGGDRVTWNSDDSVGHFTVRKIEQLASEVAAAAISSHSGFPSYTDYAANLRDQLKAADRDRAHLRKKYDALKQDYDKIYVAHSEAASALTGARYEIAQLKANTSASAEQDVSVMAAMTAVMETVCGWCRHPRYKHDEKGCNETPQMCGGMGANPRRDPFACKCPGFIAERTERK